MLKYGGKIVKYNESIFDYDGSIVSAFLDYQDGRKKNKEQPVETYMQKYYKKNETLLNFKRWIIGCEERLGVLLKRFLPCSLQISTNDELKEVLKKIDKLNKALENKKNLKELLDNTVINDQLKELLDNTVKNDQLKELLDNIKKIFKNDKLYEIFNQIEASLFKLVEIYSTVKNSESQEFFKKAIEKPRQNIKKLMIDFENIVIFTIIFTIDVKGKFDKNFSNVKNLSYDDVESIKKKLDSDLEIIKLINDSYFIEKDKSINNNDNNNDDVKYSRKKIFTLAHRICKILKKPSNKTYKKKLEDQLGNLISLQGKLTSILTLDKPKIELDNFKKVFKKCQDDINQIINDGKKTKRKRNSSIGDIIEPGQDIVEPEQTKHIKIQQDNL